MMICSGFGEEPPNDPLSLVHRLGRARTLLVSTFFCLFIFVSLDSDSVLRFPDESRLVRVSLCSGGGALRLSGLIWVRRVALDLTLWAALLWRTRLRGDTGTR